MLICKAPNFQRHSATGVTRLRMRLGLRAFDVDESQQNLMCAVTAHAEVVL